MGMLTAVEMWTKRDHQAEWNTWKGWLADIEAKVKPLPSVTTEYLMPEDLSNHSPRLLIKWDGDVLKISGTELANTLDRGTPRIQFDESSGSRPGHMESSITIMPYMMMPGDAQIVADAIFATLSHPPKFSAPEIPQGAPADVAGIWKVRMRYSCGEGSQRFLLEQQEGAVTGVHQGEHYNGNLAGKVQAQTVSFRSVMPVGGNEIEYSFSGAAKGDSMSGTVALGEYGNAQWSATRETS
jgi:hypothetical protein